MADAMYNKALQGFLDGSIDWDTHDIKVALIDTGTYTFAATHQYMNHDTVASAAKVAISGNLGTKTVTDGVADAADIVLSSVSGSTVEAIIIFKDGGGGGTSQSGTADLLICYLDSYTGLPLTPNGGNVTVAFPGDANKIFKL